MSLRRIKKIMIIAAVAAIAVILIAGLIFLQTAPFGSPPSSARLERMKKSPNYKDDVFQNLSPTPVMAKDASYLDMLK